MLKKLLISILLGLTVLFSFAPLLTAKADSENTWYDSSFPEWFSKVYDTTNSSDIFGERYTAAQVQWIFYSLFSMIIPDKPLFVCLFSGNLTTCLGNLSKQLGLTDASTNSNLATTHESLASMIFASDRPISFISYVKNLGQKFSLVTEVHAQTTSGFGFQALTVIQDLWTASRDFVYGLFVLAAIVLAFMIMFRVKISPQVVISVQSAIPKLIVALILVTFSYAIAGLLIDLMYVVIGILSLAMASVGHNVFATDPATIFKFMTTGYVGINSKIGVSAGLFGVLLLYILLFSVTIFGAVISVNGGILASITSLGVLPAAAVLIGMVVFVVMLVVIVILAIKTVWMLLKAFAQVLLLTIVAPFQIAFGVIIPGTGFSSWLKSFAANLVIFPVTGLLLTLSFVFLNTAGNMLGGAMLDFHWQALLAFIPGETSGILFAPSTGWPPLIGGGNDVMALLFVGVSFMIFSLIPKVEDVVKGIVSGRPFAYGTAIGEALGPVGNVYGQTAGQYVDIARKQFLEANTAGFRRRVGRAAEKKGEPIAPTNIPQGPQEEEIFE